MPVRRRFDFEVGGKGFILAKPQTGGRSWHRSGMADTPGRRSPTDTKYGELPDEMDHPEVWEDWSDGAFHPYRRVGENTYHWAEGFDARFPRQLIHTQLPRLFASTANPTINGARLYISPGNSVVGAPEATLTNRINGFVDAWPTGTPWVSDTGIPPNLRSILMTGKGHFIEVIPHDPTVSPIDFIIHEGWTGSTGGLYAGYPAPEYGARAVITASYIVMPVLSGTSSHVISRSDLFDSIEERGGGYAIAGNQLWRITGPMGGSQHLTILRNMDVRNTPVATANWSASINVGDGEAPIQDIIALEDQIFVSTARGLFGGDETGTFVNVLGELSSQVHPENGRDIGIYNNGIVYPHISGLWLYRQDGFTGYGENISRKISSSRVLTGRFRCSKAISGWLYGGFYTGSQSFLLAGQPRGEDWVWHALQRLPHTTKISRMHVDGAIYASNGTVLPNRLWIATDASIDTSGTAPVYWIPLPPGNANPLAPALGFTPNYIGSARIDLGAVDWGAPGTAKVYRSVEIQADNLASGSQWCKVYYSIDNESTRRLLGTSAKSSKDELFFPNSVGSFMTGQSIELSLESFTASSAITPIYRSLVLRGALRPKAVETIQAQVRIADGMRDRQAGPMRSAAMMLQELRDLVVTQQPQQLVDLAGATNYVTFRPWIEEQEVWQQGNEEPELVAGIQMIVQRFE